MGESWDRMANLGRDLHGLGYHVLMFDLRGHGESDPHRLTMGRLERRDLRCVLGWALRRGFRPDQIGWIGRSMGASTILMEAAENSDVRLAVLDSPYGHLPELLDQQLTEHSRLPKAFNPGIILAAHRVFGVRTDDLIPIRHARRWGNRPMLLIHGRQDRVVPVGQSRMLANSVGSSCTLITLPGVEHVEAYRKLGSSYVQLVDRFLDRHLAP
jgi:pimeloyl-ACP methyl ester carboxylesterase